MKPECGEYQERIARYLLGDLAVEEKRSLEDHLSRCPDCRSEHESYIRTLDIMKSADDEPVPHHFFVYPEERNLNPWASFLLMKPLWQVLTAASAALLVFVSIGLAVASSHSRINVADLKKDILNTIEEKNRADKIAWFREVRAEIARSGANLSQQQKAELAATLARLDSRFTDRLSLTEGRARIDAQKLASDLYKSVAQQRAQDLDIISLRLDNIEANNFIETRQTDVILDTLLQAAELRLR